MQNHTGLRFGCVADDFTGAGDIASFLAKGGLRTVLINGVPEELPAGGDFEAAVIALKSRTQETAAAVAESLAAFDWLREHGAGTLYFKYCSTFDSTPQGNIGPVIDAALARYGIPYTLVCPTLLVNRRAVRDGVLYVDGVPLAESHMKDHPLTPMWASDLAELMRLQGKWPLYKVSAAQLADPAGLRRTVDTYRQRDGRFYLCPDYYEPEQGERIAAIFDDLALLTGGSGLGGDLARRLSGGGPSAEYAAAGERGGPRLLLAGSCSVATRGQVRRFLEAGGRAVMLHPRQLASGGQTLEGLCAFRREHGGEDVLFYSSGSGGGLEGKPDLRDAELLEETLAAIAVDAVGAGLRRLVVAGGETSGAVTKALGYRSFHIGESAAPGVPVMIPTGNAEMSLVLKSGNFGAEDFFLTALQKEGAR